MGDAAYTGSACRDQLARFQQCLHVNDSTINIAYSGNQERQESRANGLKSGVAFLKFSEMLSAGCEEQLEPFACLYLFPLETCGEDGRANTHRPSRQTCESIRDQVCAKELESAERLAESYGIAIELPDCSILDDMENVDLLEMCQVKGW